MKTISFIILYASSCVLLFGQNTNSGLIVGSSGSGTNNSTSLTWTIGQPIVKNFDTGNGSLSSGNQQTDVKLLITALDDKSNSSFNIQAYPNPTQDQLKVTFETTATATSSYDLMSSDGHCITTRAALINNQLINVSSLTSGMYILTIYINNSVQSFKIIKQ